MNKTTILAAAFLAALLSGPALAQDSTNSPDGDIGYTAPPDPQGGNQITSNAWCRGSVDATYIVCDQSAPMMSGDDLGNHRMTQILQTGTYGISASDGVIDLMNPTLIQGGMTVTGNGQISGNANITGATDLTGPVLARGTLRSNGQASFGGGPSGSLTLTSNGNAGIIGDLYITGQTHAVAYMHSSDRTLKTNIEQIQDPFAIIDRLNGYHYNWAASGVAAYGVIAQDVQTVMPEAVATNHEGKLAVEYDQLISPMIEAIKWLKADNDNLRAEIEELKQAQ